MYSAKHVRARVFLRTLACYVEGHLRQRLAPILFEGHDREGANGRRTSPVRKAEVSDSAKQNADAKIAQGAQGGLPVNSMRTLLDHLGSLTHYRIALTGSPGHTFNVATEPIPLKQRAFQLLELGPNRMFPVDVPAS